MAEPADLLAVTLESERLLLRPIAREMSSLILAQEVERALSELIRTDPRHLARSVVRRAGT